jgi:hypothetical protein
MTTPPLHPQLYDPAYWPHALIESLIWWYPLVTPTRTEALEHLLLGNGNGYEWDDRGMLRCVFSHIEPSQDEDKLARYEVRALQWEENGLPSMAEHERAEGAMCQATRDDYLHRARTYGPVTDTYSMGGETYQKTYSSETLSRWTIMGRAPENVRPAWKQAIDETRELFGHQFIEQGRLW